MHALSHVALRSEGVLMPEVAAQRQEIGGMLWHWQRPRPLHQENPTPAHAYTEANHKLGACRMLLVSAVVERPGQLKLGHVKSAFCFERWFLSIASLDNACKTSPIRHQHTSKAFSPFSNSMSTSHSRPRTAAGKLVILFKSSLKAVFV